MTAPATRRTVFHVPEVDCPSGERLIRMALDGVDELTFDLKGRTLDVLRSDERSTLRILRLR